MNLDYSSADTDYSKANLFNQYFHSVFHDLSFLPNIEDMPEMHDFLSDIAISVQDVYEALFSFL